MKLTVEDLRSWVAENATELTAARLACDDPDLMFLNRIAPEKSEQLWNSGCWLADVLRKNGADDEQVQQIQMAAGQRSFFGDAFTAAVDYANEFIATGDTLEKGGIELADKINREAFGSR